MKIPGIKGFYSSGGTCPLEREPPDVMREMKFTFEEPEGPIRFLDEQTSSSEDLFPGHPIPFRVPRHAMPRLREICQTASPDYTFLAICTDGRQFARVEGRDIATFLAANLA